jgi:apolipoprotein D and lipocalin family protein
MKILIQYYQILFYIFFFCLIYTSNGQNKNQPITVGSVDLNRYVGVWYEIAKIPNRFQKQCARNVTATYSLNDDGTIQVVNRCIQEDGSEDKVTGKARIVDKKTNAKLEVSFVSIFGFHLFWGDYWIIGLDRDYQYAVVGSPTRKYGWILCREKSMPEAMFQQVKQILINQGYNPDDFVTTTQE